MWPKRKEYPVVTNEAYARWLRAQRPPWLWFLNRSTLEQEQLACLGDAYVDGCLTAGADASAAQEDEEAKIRELGAKLAQRALGREVPQDAPQATAPRPPPSMAGVTKRREEREQQEQDGKDGGKRLFGREPDEVVP